MAPYSSTLAWKIPWAEEPGRLQSMGSQESDTTERLHFHFHASEKEMATRSSVLAWRIPGTVEPDGLKSMGLQRVGHHGVIMNKCKKSKLYWTRPRVQLLSGVQLFETPWTAVHKAFLSITNSQRLLKPMSLALVMPSNHLILCPPFLSSICHSIRVLFSESVLHMGWQKYWS